MRHFILRAIVSGVGLLFVANAFFRDSIIIEGVVASILAVAVIGIVNALVRPLLFVVKIFTFPVNLLTLGLFGLILSWVVNALIFLVVGNAEMIPGFQVKGFIPALLGSFALSVINSLATMLIGRTKEDDR
ncbi:MAG: phage holin family protein [Abditibacteriales bacterium]|nr:phage holin family protein [Abditibacteriales bacterium]MDW8365462.1 phage holin family protein [Abditibacteriales bacterium]